ncbi:hypothetical protein E2493_14385 [Sphingomonas parva]|uniref:DUF4426 domain-containing protein n=1 Tax=Sphingomonas parva TaxID=2555898 RepID=A0A4Y8ZSX1_9SPHN|nr:hypothetical protein [Sphingomonas parva]TFI57556.1 hypothetical protein E2493_14385 [Sphingomonas parva]
MGDDYSRRGLMSYKLASLVIAATLCSAFAPEPADEGARAVLRSVETGEHASGATAPYGLPLYPGARVDLSMMGGMALGVTVAADVRALGNFYSAALTERGYRIDEDETLNGRRTIHASERRAPSSKMTVSVSPNAKDPARFTLVFMKLKTP